MGAPQPDPRSRSLSCTVWQREEKQKEHQETTRKGLPGTRLEGGPAKKGEENETASVVGHTISQKMSPFPSSPPLFFTSPLPPLPFHISVARRRRRGRRRRRRPLPNVSWPRFPSKFFLPAFPSFCACPPFPFFALLWAATLPFAAGRIFPPPPPACQAKKAETGSVKPEPGNKQESFLSLFFLSLSSVFFYVPKAKA